MNVHRSIASSFIAIVIHLPQPVYTLSSVKNHDFWCYHLSFFVVAHSQMQLYKIKWQWHRIKEVGECSNASSKRGQRNAPPLWNHNHCKESDDMCVPLVVEEIFLKNSARCRRLRWLLKFVVFPPFASTFFRHKRHITSPEFTGCPLSSDLKPKYSHTTDLLLGLLTRSMILCFLAGNPLCWVAAALQELG